MKTSSSFTLPLLAKKEGVGPDSKQREDKAKQASTLRSSPGAASGSPSSPPATRASPRIAKRRKLEEGSNEAQAVKSEPGLESGQDEPPSSPATSSASPSRKKRAKKNNRGWDDPEKSIYAHLSGTPDWLAEDLDCAW